MGALPPTPGSRSSQTASCSAGSSVTRTTSEPSPCYLNFEGEVSWEPEHGLQVVFDHSGAVCRVGPYSGRLTNTGPFAGAVYGW